MRVAPLQHAELSAARAILEAACAFDRAAVVAEEKLFEPGPERAPKPGAPVVLSAPQAFGVWEGDGLVGVAAVCARWLRVLAVSPAARGRGAGTALLDACVAAGGRRTLDQPGNYLAPGIDLRDTQTIAWLEKRGWTRVGEPRTNVLIRVRGNPRVSRVRADELASAACARGYEIRRANVDEKPLLEAAAAEFGGAWPHELARALAFAPEPGVHVALRDGAYCGFAAHDGNNRGLGWFGPAGTWPAHRGQGLGEALLVACLADVAEAHERCEVAWIGPRPFYEKVAGIESERQFIALARR